MAFELNNLAAWKVAIGEMNEFIRELKKDSDRSAAIVGGSILEARLRDVMQATNEPLAQSKPNFNRLIEWGGKWNLLSQTQTKDLHTIRKIRNEFAHSRIVKLQFSHQKITNFVSSLQFASSLEGFHDLPNRCKYEMTVLQIGADLLALVGASKSPCITPSFESLTGMKLRESASEAFQELEVTQ